jgi:CyaY protein
VITPNTPVRQIWISALSTSFKLDWDQAASVFVLPRTGEALAPLVDRLIAEQLES